MDQIKTALQELLNQIDGMSPMDVSSRLYSLSLQIAFEAMGGNKSVSISSKLDHDDIPNREEPSIIATRVVSPPDSPVKETVITLSSRALKGLEIRGDIPRR